MNHRDYITHYSRGEPFLSITSIDREKWPETIAKLSESNAWGLNRFSDLKYLEDRLKVEKIIREEFISKGGKPELEHPIYFFLGSNVRFEEHKLNKKYKMDLKDIPHDAISFTYGDSMLAYIEENRTQSGEKYQNPLCKKVFCIGDLEGLFSHIDFPKNDPLSIEAQLWVDPKKVNRE
jgi:hypothetical protein